MQASIQDFEAIYEVIIKGVDVVQGNKKERVECLLIVIVLFNLRNFK